MIFGLIITFDIKNYNIEKVIKYTKYYFIKIIKF